MREEALLKLFQETDALRRGHFELSSGLHSSVFFQSALVLQYPDRAEVLGRSLAKMFRTLQPQAVCGPALGALIIGWEVARELGVRGLFTERKDGVMGLRRGFTLGRNERVVIVEDVVTTGKSTRETMDTVRATGAQIVGVGAIVDRSGGDIDFGVPFYSLLSMPVNTSRPEDCRECADGIPLEKPGSRTPAGKT